MSAVDGRRPAQAPAFQVGLLPAADTMAYLVVALPAGLLADRLGRRRLAAGEGLPRGMAARLAPGRMTGLAAGVRRAGARCGGPRCRQVADALTALGRGTKSQSP